MEDWRDDGAAGTPVASQPQQKLGAPDLKLLAPTQPSGREIMPPILGWPSTEGPQLGASGLCMETPADWGGSAAVAQHPPQCGPFPLPRLPPSTHHDHLLGASPHHRTWTQVLASGSAFCDKYLREWHHPPTPDAESVQPSPGQACQTQVTERPPSRPRPGPVSQLCFHLPWT